MSSCTHRQDGRLHVKIDGVHDDKHLLVFVGEAVGLAKGRFAVILNPAVLAQEGGGQPERQTQLERETMDSRGQQDGALTCVIREDECAAMHVRHQSYVGPLGLGLIHKPEKSKKC